MTVDPAQDLTRYKRELYHHEQAARRLRKVVEALEEAVRDGSAVIEESATLRIREPHRPTTAQRSIQAVEVPPRRRRGTASGGRGLKEVLRDLYADGKRRSVDETIREVIERGMFTEENIQQRASFTNRLNDLTHDGYLRQVARGVHELASPNGRTGDDQSRLTEGIPTPDGQEGKPSLSTGTGGEGGTATEGAPGVVNRAGP